MPSLSQVTRWARAYAETQWRGLLLLPRTWFLLLWLTLRERSAHRAAIRGLRRAAREPPRGDDPLREIAKGLYEVVPAYLDASAIPQRGPTVVHLLGTGEHVCSPLVGLAALCRAEPKLRMCRHVIADTPTDAASFLGPHEFGTRLRRALEPVLAQNRERIVLVGLSRGAIAALNIAIDIAHGHNTRVGVLSLSPPLARPTRPPQTVLNIGWFLPTLLNFIRMIKVQPWLQRPADWLLRRIYLQFSGFVLAELQMVSEASLQMFARAVYGRSAQELCLRAVREFELLTRISDAELRHTSSNVTRRIAQSDAMRAIVCWGREDVWVDVPACATRVKAQLARDAVPEERFSVHVLDGHNHGLCREPDKDFSKLAALLWQACEHAASASSDEVEATEQTA